MLDTPTEKGEKVEYVWYKSINKGNFTEVEQSKAGDEYNIDTEDGSWLNIAIDDGALSTEKNRSSVQYYIVLKINGEEIAQSEAYSVKYYDELQNGSFESPEIPYKATVLKDNQKQIVDNLSNYQYSNEEYANAGGVWQSTAEVESGYYYQNQNSNQFKNVALEIIKEGNNSGQSDYLWSGDWSNAAPDGEQFAELNCEAAGALYQDVLTIKGEPLNYWLKHRARGYSSSHQSEFDTMYLVIMPTAIAEEKNLTTQEKLEAYLNDLGIEADQKYSQVGERKYDKGNGVLVVRITSNDKEWHPVEGIGGYTPTSNLTRFFFMAGHTAAEDQPNANGSNGKTRGNFLDDVGFSQKLPSANPDQYNLFIQKTVTGLTDEEFEELKKELEFDVAVKNSKGNQVAKETVRADNQAFQWTERGNKWTGTYYLEDQDIEYGDTYTCTITEKNYTVGTYEWTGKVQVNGAESSDSDSGSASVSSGSSIRYVFNNAYTAPEAELTIYKENSQGTALSGAKFQLVNDEGTAAYSKEVTTEGKDGSATFTELKKGTYTLSETQAPDDYLVEAGKTWKVVVNSVNGTLQATLYESDGKTLVTGNKILNYTSQELAAKNLKYDKTVQLTDWDERTYQINITASSNVSESSTIISKPVIDVMFVFDLSASMNRTSSGDNQTSFDEIGGYSSVKDNLDTTKVYYFGNDSSSTSGLSGYKSADSPMKYIDGKWQYYDKDRESWRQIDDKSTKKIYKWDSRITALKEAASSFVINMADQSPQSKIGVATFSSYGYGKNTLVSDLAAVGSSEPTDLLKEINQLFANGGTSPQDGLSLAKTELGREGDTNAKYVILFSDGAPSERDDTSSSESIATELKEAGYTVITIGFGLTDDVVPGRERYWDWDQWDWIDGVTTEQWLKNYIASPGYAYTADSADELKKLFNDIQSSIMQTYDITGAQITDVIDARFELTDKEKARLMSDGAVIEENDDGTTTITWSDQTIPYLKDGATAWSKTINIVAKADYIGGNNVTTNVAPYSCIHTGYGDAELPQPTVNVKAELEVDNYAVTIFKGDTVPTEEGCDAVVDSLFDVDKITEKYNNSKDPLTAEELTLSWYKDENLTQLVTEEELKTALSTPEENTTYYLKVTYDAGSPSDDGESTENTDGHIAGYDDGNEDTIVQAKNVDQKEYPGAYYGVYQVKVISGSIRITKTLEEVSDKKQTFTFQIKDEDGNTQSVTITVPAGQISATAAAVTELSRGAYTVTEAETEGYSVKEVSTEGSNCKEETKEYEITFTMGTFLEDNEEKDTITDTDENYNKGILGTVNFTNEKTIADWEIIKKSSSDGGPTLGDAQFTLSKEGENNPSYYGKSVSEGEEKGQVQWYEDPDFENPLPKIPGGTYILEETKAPAGYQKSSIQWKIEISKNGGLKQITLEGEAVTGNPVKDPETGGETVEYVYFNDAVYDLPSAGGPGIFLYMIGGTLLLMAGSLMIYINRRKGVLRK